MDRTSCLQREDERRRELKRSVARCVDVADGLSRGLLGGKVRDCKRTVFCGGPDGSVKGIGRKTRVIGYV